MEEIFGLQSVKILKEYREFIRSYKERLECLVPVIGLARGNTAGKKDVCTLGRISQAVRDINRIIFDGGDQEKLCIFDVIPDRGSIEKFFRIITLQRTIRQRLN